MSTTGTKNKAKRLVGTTDHQQSTRTGERPNRSGAIREAIFGINDGLVATVGLVSGEALAHQPHRAVLIAALSAVGAAMVSMAVGSYLATTAENDFMQKEIRDQRRHIERRPERERAHVRRLLEEIGLPRSSLLPVEANIVRSRSRWLNFMVRENLGIHPDRTERPLANALIMGVAVIVGSAPPVVPYLLALPGEWSRNSSWGLAVISALVLGAVKGRLTQSPVVGSALWFGLLVSLSSLVGALIGFGVGKVA